MPRPDTGAGLGTLLAVCVVSIAVSTAISQLLIRRAAQEHEREHARLSPVVVLDMASAMTGVRDNRDEAARRLQRLQAQAQALAERGVVVMAGNAVYAAPRRAWLRWNAPEDGDDEHGGR